MEKPQSFLSIPNSIIIGSLLISVSILISGGIIKIGPRAGKQIAGAATAASPQPQQQQAAPQQPTVTLAQVKDAFNKSQIKFGDTNKKLVVVEVADPSCPFCHIAAGKNPELNKQVGSRFTLVADGGTYVAPVPELKKLVDNNQAAFAWIYTPGHGNGEMGTRALYCAFEKGKFWEVHDLIMSAKGYEIQNGTDVTNNPTKGPIVKNDKTKSQDLADFLAPAMNPTDMKACLDSGKYDSRLNTDISLAQSLGVTGTPGFYLNNKLFGGAYNYTDIESAVKSALGS